MMVIFNRITKCPSKEISAQCAQTSDLCGNLAKRMDRLNKNQKTELFNENPKVKLVPSLISKTIGSTIIKVDQVKSMSFER